MTTIREFIEDWDKFAQEGERPAIYPVFTQDPSAKTPDMNADGTINLTVSFDTEAYIAHCSADVADAMDSTGVTERDIRQAIDAYLNTVKEMRGLYCPTPVGDVFPHSVETDGVVASFSLSVGGRPTFYQEDGTILELRFRTRHRSRRLIRRQAKQKIGTAVLTVVFTVCEPVPHIEMKSVLVP